jgi:methionyl aminopeptidase
VIKLKTKEDIEILKEGGKRLAKVLEIVKKYAKNGAKASDLDAIAYENIIKMGGYPSFLNYKPEFAAQAFPNTLCVSVNEVIVHGIPKEDLILKNGDLVSLDIGMKYEGLYTDMAITVGIGRLKDEDKKLLIATRNALKEAIKAARYGNTLGDIGYAIYSTAKKYNFKVIRDLVGHGVGYAVHEDPPVFNYGNRGEGIKLQDGLVIAIEPMLTFSTNNIKENIDGSFSTADGKKAAHFEHTIAILKDKTIIITQ